MPFYMMFDPIYWVVAGVGLIASLWAQWRVKSTFARFQQVGVASGMTGAQAARAVCAAAGVHDVSIERNQGFLSDHYDPRSKTLRLSPAVHDGRSISSIAVAAHEAGHSIQDLRNYPWLGLRSKLVPVTQLGSQLWALPFMLGMALAAGQRAAGSGLGVTLMQIGVLMFGAVVLFQLVTLPVEIDASRRAKAVLASSGIVRTQAEAEGVSKVLGAAAMTYVAAALSGVLMLVYLVMRVQSARGNGDRS